MDLNFTLRARRLERHLRKLVTQRITRSLARFGQHLQQVTADIKHEREYRARVKLVVHLNNGQSLVSTGQHRNAMTAVGEAIDQLRRNLAERCRGIDQVDRRLGSEARDKVRSA